MKTFKYLFALSVLVAGCDTTPEVKKTDPLESGRGFIEASLKGNYKEAEKYVLPDSTNLEYFNGMKQFNEKQDNQEKLGYRNASIIIDSVQQINDSVAFIFFANSYKMKPSKLKMVKHNNEWLVDFKFSFIDN